MQIRHPSQTRKVGEWIGRRVGGGGGQDESKGHGRMETGCKGAVMSLPRFQTVTVILGLAKSYIHLHMKVFYVAFWPSAYDIVCHILSNPQNKHSSQQRCWMCSFKNNVFHRFLSQRSNLFLLPLPPYAFVFSFISIKRINILEGILSLAFLSFLHLPQCEALIASARLLLEDEQFAVVWRRSVPSTFSVKSNHVADTETCSQASRWQVWIHQPIPDSQI